MTASEESQCREKLKKLRLLGVFGVRIGKPNGYGTPDGDGREAAGLTTEDGLTRANGSTAAHLTESQ